LLSLFGLGSAMSNTRLHDTSSIEPVKL
jgi:hypothetical protein